MEKKGVVSDYLPWLIIAIAVLVIASLAIFSFKEKGVSVIDSIKNLFSGR